jgi:hypothetical protein
VFVQLQERPACKLILQRGIKATEYWGYCEEVGCDVWGVLLSLKGTLGEPKGLWLPESLLRPGTSEYVMGVEVPANFGGPIPDGMEVIDLPPTAYLVFQGPPYAGDEEIGQAVDAIWRAIDEYLPERIGWQWSDHAPRYQLAPLPERGCVHGMPVKPVQ